MLWNSAESYCQCPHQDSALDTTFESAIIWDPNNFKCACRKAAFFIDYYQTPAVIVHSELVGHCSCPQPASPVTSPQFALLWDDAAWRCQCPPLAIVGFNSTA